MKITAIRTVRLAVPLDPPFPAAWDPVPRRSFAVTLVRVETDAGVVGVGSGDTMDGFAAFEHLFVGQDPLAIARHVRALETIDLHARRHSPPPPRAARPPPPAPASGGGGPRGGPPPAGCPPCRWRRCSAGPRRES